MVSYSIEIITNRDYRLEVMTHKVRQKPPEKVWADFKEREKISSEQLEKFQAYQALLSEWNKVMNLTAIRGLSEIVHRHFSDSLALRNFIDLSSAVIADIGSGAGFPGIPLKIMFPDLGVVLIEVSKKKQRFLNTVIKTLGLKDIEICGLDWRTFLRTTEGEIDYFLARASMDPVELCRMFKPGCTYKGSKLVYWATSDWEPDQAIEKFVLKEFNYTLKRKKRKLVLMGL